MLAELPNTIGAYHITGSNLIVANRTILNNIKLSSSTEEFNSFVFMILAHEYLHSLGEMDEGRVRLLVKRVCTEFFGPDHTSVKMADGNFLEQYPALKLLGKGRFGSDFEVVREFDKSSMPYIG